MDLMSLTAVELGKKIQAKEVTVEEAVKAAIASIKAKEEKINSFVTIDEEGALKKAAEVQAKIDAVHIWRTWSVFYRSRYDGYCNRYGNRRIVV